VDQLEERYAGFAGLNLCFETREGILKHCSQANARELGELGRRFIERTQPSLEAQIADLADAIAYNNHDVDDGLRSGLVTVEELRSVGLFARQHEAVTARYGELPGRRMVHEVIRRMIHEVVSDLIEESGRRLAAAKPADIDAVRAHPGPLIGFSTEREREHRQMKKFLRTRLYRHERMQASRHGAGKVLEELFRGFMRDIKLMPPEHREAALALEAAGGEAGRARAVTDYIAGMTDRYAYQEHARIGGDAPPQG
jgi:dGTPase